MQLQRPPSHLQFVLQGTPEEVFEPDAVADAPLVRFVAYGKNQRVFGWVRLEADRLTDLLNAHDELHLVDVEIEQRQRRVGALRALERQLQVALERAPVA